MRDGAGGERHQHAALQRASGEAAVLRAALPPVLAGDPLGVEIDEREVGALPYGDGRGGQLEQRGAGGHALDEQWQVDEPLQYEAGVKRCERGLKTRTAHGSLLEGDLLLVAGVRRVVGGDA